MTQLVYLGPSMSGQGITISKGTIFSGPAMSEVEQKKADSPEFNALFIDVERVGAARFDIQKGDTFLANCYKTVLNEYLSAKNKGSV